MYLTFWGHDIVNQVVKYAKYMESIFALFIYFLYIVFISISFFF